MANGLSNILSGINHTEQQAASDMMTALGNLATPEPASDIMADLALARGHSRNRLEELQEDVTLGLVTAFQHSEKEEYDNQITGLSNEILDSEQQLQHLAQNPQLLEVPADQPLNFITKLGVAFSNIGGDSKLYEGIMAEKRAHSNYERQVALQNIAIQNRFDNQQRVGIMQRLSQNRAQLTQFQIARARAADKAGLEGKARQKANAKFDLGLIRTNLKFTAADAWADPDNRVAFTEMGISLIDLENMQGMDIPPERTPKAEPAKKGMTFAAWNKDIAPDINGAIEDLENGGKTDRRTKEVTLFDADGVEDTLEFIRMRLSTLDTNSQGYETLMAGYLRQVKEGLRKGAIIRDQPAHEQMINDKVDELEASLRAKRDERQASNDGGPTFAERVFGNVLTQHRERAETTGIVARREQAERDDLAEAQFAAGALDEFFGDNIDLAR